MIIATVIAVVLLIVFIRYFVCDADGIGEGILFTLISLFFAGIIFIMLLVLASCSGDGIPESEQEVGLAKTTNIIALKDSACASGSFFLGSGHIDDDLYYYYAVETERGYKVDKLRADKCYIRYSADTPRIEEYVAAGFKHWYDYIYAMPSVSYQVVYIPEGSITNAFEVDLE